MVVADNKAVVQSVWRLLNTSEGEIPYYRAYGLDLSQFIQKPMSKDLAQRINKYITHKIEVYETRVSVYKVNVLADLDREILRYTYYLKVKGTNNIVELPELPIYIGNI